MPVIPIKPTTPNEVKTEYTPKFQGTDVRITSEDYDSYKAYTGKVMPNTDLDYLRAVNQSVFENRITRNASCFGGRVFTCGFFIRNRREIPVLHTKFFRFLMKYFRFLVKFGENNQFF